MLEYPRSIHAIPGVGSLTKLLTFLTKVKIFFRVLIDTTFIAACEPSYTCLYESLCSFAIERSEEPECCNVIVL